MDNNIELYRKDSSLWILLTVTDDDDDAVDLSGFTAKVTVKQYKSDSFANAKIKINSTDDSAQFDLPSLASGLVYFKFLPANTDLDPGKYYYDVEITDGTDVYTFPDAGDNARFIIHEDITNE